MREQFEKLPAIARIIKEHDAFYCNKDEWYVCPDDDQFAEAYLGGAWYAYQEQKKKIDEIVGIVREADISDGNSSVAIVHDEIKELLK